ncbi:MAG: oligosaccharide flippase family protein [Planctomycetota bacterium]|nr:oligosaccharide flippase family protein [Planctomycetota bacterium]
MALAISPIDSAELQEERAVSFGIPESESAKKEMSTDTIASGISFMLIANVLQRGIGFLRNIAFCHFLSEHELGLWALASGFFILAAPLSVLGLPGSLGRFTEFYRLRNQLVSYLGWMVVGSAAGLLAFSLALVMFPWWSATLIFDNEESFATVAMLTATLVLVVGFNFLTELLSGLRQNRIVSGMQMVNSISFTMMSVSWLLLFSDWRGVLLSFAIASLLGCIPGLIGLRNTCAIAFTNQEPMDTRGMWSRVLPFAASVWLMNLLGNLFDVVDRYMLLHLANTEVLSSTAIVGQYHSGRILPVLITSLAAMLNGMILPHLSADWEAGERETVKARIRSTMKLMTLFFWALSIGGMVVSPFVFQTLLIGRYADGLSIMPLGLVHCTYTALAAFLCSYFWCEEKGGLVTKLMAFGLILNIALNFLMVPLWCVYGAMFATFLAGVAILGMTIAIMARHDCWVGPQAVVLAVLPSSLAVSTSLSMLVFTVVILLISRTNLLLSADEKEALSVHMRPILRRLGLAADGRCFWR